jgi:hypothetical protein
MMLEHGKNDNHDEEDKYLMYDYLLFPLTLSLTALGSISPICLKCHKLKKFLSGMKAILHVFLF